MSIFHNISLSLGGLLLRCLFWDIPRSITEQTDVFKRSALKWLVQITPGTQEQDPNPWLVCKGGSGVFKKDCSYTLGLQLLFIINEGILKQNKNTPPNNHQLYKLFFPRSGCSTVFLGEIFLQAFTGCVSDINWFQYMVLTEKLVFHFS